jgi:MtN3 and saliva related transmembrane protein
MNTVTLLGLLAAACTSVSFVPQVLHSLRTRDTRGVSFGMYTVFTLGIALWLVYGAILGDWPIILANSVTLVLCALVIALKLRHG